MNRTVWQPAVVTRITEDKLWLHLDALSACQRCLQGDGCGAGVFARLFARRHASVVIDGVHDCKVGQRIRIGIDERSLMLAAVFLYGLPLTGFLTGALAGHVLAAESVFQDLLALAAGLLTAALVHVLTRLRQTPGLTPMVDLQGCTSPVTLESGAE
jgi:sigma-E factor negative regulatory protein RseC